MIVACEALRWYPCLAAGLNAARAQFSPSLNDVGEILHPVSCLPILHLCSCFHTRPVHCIASQKVARFRLGAPPRFARLFGICCQDRTVCALKHHASAVKLRTLQRTDSDLLAAGALATTFLSAYVLTCPTEAMLTRYTPAPWSSHNGRNWHRNKVSHSNYPSTACERINRRVCLSAV